MVQRREERLSSPTIDVAGDAHALVLEAVEHPRATRSLAAITAL